MNIQSRHAIAGLAALLALGANAAVQAATGSFEQSLRVDEPVELEVRSGSGDVSVRAGAAGRVRVVGHIRVHDRFGRSNDEAEQIVRELEADPPVSTCPTMRASSSRPGRAPVKSTRRIRSRSRAASAAGICAARCAAAAL